MPQTARAGIAGNTDTSFLKALALIFMFIDHLGVVIFPGVTELRVIGRMAFPLYAWCLVVGINKTKDPLRYLFRLLVLAVISQPLYMMALRHGWTNFGILFTLSLSLVALWGMKAKFLGSQFWAPLLCYVATGFLDMDYGWKGLTFILLLYLARGSKSGLCATYLAFALFWGSSTTQVSSLFGYPLGFLSWPGIGTALSALFRLQSMVWLSLPLIALNTNTGLRMPKWVGYGLYPLHLVVLIVLRLLTGTPITALVSAF